MRQRQPRSDLPHAFVDALMLECAVRLAGEHCPEPATLAAARADRPRRASS
ncbi:hypothetical protein ACH4NS_28195 [Streptomyces mutabilis]|uniref:hypothetical protein n=1 Tax=Streptomyces mutabilis TaxID=67332 RepID=UPI0015C97299